MTEEPTNFPTLDWGSLRSIRRENAMYRREHRKMLRWWKKHYDPTRSLFPSEPPSLFQIPEDGAW